MATGRRRITTTNRRYKRKTTRKRTGAAPRLTAAKMRATVDAYKKVGNQLKNDFNRSHIGKFINFFRQR